MQSQKPHGRGSARRQLTDIILATNLDARYWMQVLGVSRMQLADAVQAVGTQVEKVAEYLQLPERRNHVQSENQRSLVEDGGGRVPLIRTDIPASPRGAERVRVSSSTGAADAGRCATGDLRWQLMRKRRNRMNGRRMTRIQLGLSSSRDSMSVALSRWDDEGGAGPGAGTPS
jgi:hypothetical protein